MGGNPSFIRGLLDKAAQWSPVVNTDLLVVLTPGPWMVPMSMSMSTACVCPEKRSRFKNNRPMQPEDIVIVVFSCRHQETKLLLST